MVDYVEAFNIPGVGSVGIEDRYAAPPPSAEAARVDGKKRFQVWSGGCGIGYAADMNEAREIIHTHVTKRLSGDLKKHRQQVNQLEWAMHMLGSDQFNLGKFFDHSKMPEWTES